MIIKKTVWQITHLNTGESTSVVHIKTKFNQFEKKLLKNFQT